MFALQSLNYIPPSQTPQISHHASLFLPFKGKWGQTEAELRQPLSCLGVFFWSTLTFCMGTPPPLWSAISPHPSVKSWRAGHPVSAFPAGRGGLKAGALSCSSLSFAEILVMPRPWEKFTGWADRALSTSLAVLIVWR